MRDLIMNLLASVIAAASVWIGGRLLRYRKLAVRRRFFGLTAGGSCALVVAGQHAAACASIHPHDVSALVELATVARGCGARADVITAQSSAPELGRVTEFCVGGALTNPRTAAHIRSLLHAVTVEPGDDDQGITIRVGEDEYRREVGRADYALVARVRGVTGSRPVFVIAGQTAQANLAAARFLANNHPRLLRTHRPAGYFCLILRVVEPEIYGPDYVEVVRDATADTVRGTTVDGQPGAPDELWPTRRATR